MLREVCGIEITWWSLVLGPSIELTVVIPVADPMVEIYSGGSGAGGGTEAAYQRREHLSKVSNSKIIFQA